MSLVLKRLGSSERRCWDTSFLALLRVCHWCVATFEILRSDLEGNRGGMMSFKDSAKSLFSAIAPSCSSIQNIEIVFG